MLDKVTVRKRIICLLLVGLDDNVSRSLGSWDLGQGFLNGRIAWSMMASSSGPQIVGDVLHWDVHVHGSVQHVGQAHDFVVGGEHHKKDAKIEGWEGKVSAVCYTPLLQHCMARLL